MNLLYFSCLLVFMILVSHGSDLKDKTELATISNNETNVFVQILLKSSQNRVWILHQFLTMRDILKLQVTCKDITTIFYDPKTRLEPKTASVMFCSAENREMLKHFQSETYTKLCDSLNFYALRNNRFAILNDFDFIHWSPEYLKFLMPELMKNPGDKETFYDEKQMPLMGIVGKERQLQCYGFCKLCALCPPSGSFCAHRPKNVKHVKMAAIVHEACAVVLENGELILWGKGNAAKLPREFQKTGSKNVKKLYSNWCVFLALLTDNTLIGWGSDEESGTQIPEYVQGKVYEIYSSGRAFTALCNDKDRTVISWGKPDYGGVCPGIVYNVKSIVSTDYSFAVIRIDNSVQAWGYPSFGGKIPSDLYGQLRYNTKMIFGNSRAFVALLYTGKILCWGDEQLFTPRLFNGNLFGRQVTSPTKMIFSTEEAFAELKYDNSVHYYGGNPNDTNYHYKCKMTNTNIMMVCSNAKSFATLDFDGTVHTFGAGTHGGKIPYYLEAKLTENVISLFSEKMGFKAICKDGEIITW